MRSRCETKAGSVTSRAMNPVLAEILRTKRSLTADGKTSVDIHSAISEEEGQMLGRLIAARKPKISLEVGLAFGISALFICEAMQQATLNPRHIVIDPAQHAEQHWKGIGLSNLTRAGFGEFVEFIEKPSQIALAELVSAGRKIDFAFIDGEHLFDHALVDFFFVDKLLNIGGTVVLDDTVWPSIRRLARFIATNRAYRVIDHVGSDIPGKSRHLSYSTPETIELDRKLGLEGTSIAFEKMGNDSRRYDYYEPF